MATITDAALGIDAGDPDRLEEQLPVALVRGEREQLLELVDDEDDFGVAGNDQIDRLDEAAGTALERVAQPRGRTHGDPEQRRLELLERVRPREHLGDEALDRSVECTSTDRGHQARTNHGRLAAPARADDGQEASAGLTVD